MKPALLATAVLTTAVLTAMLTACATTSPPGGEARVRQTGPLRCELIASEYNAEGDLIARVRFTNQDSKGFCIEQVTWQPVLLQSGRYTAVKDSTPKPLEIIPAGVCVTGSGTTESELRIKDAHMTAASQETPDFSIGVAITTSHSRARGTCIVKGLELAPIATTTGT